MTGGRRPRVGTTAVEAEIHYPAGSGPIGDGVPVISRLSKRAKSVLGEAATELGGASRSRVRTISRTSRQLHRIARRKGGPGREAFKAAHTKSIGAAELTGARGKRVLEALKQSGRKGGLGRGLIPNRLND